MRFVIAPDWFMKLSDSDRVKSQAVLEIFGYADHSPTPCIERGAVPYPNIVRRCKHKNRYYWTVGYLKNFMKLPTELNEHYPTK